MFYNSSRDVKASRPNHLASASLFLARIWCQGARRSRRQRCEHPGAEWGRVWRGLPAPQPTRGSGGALWAPPARSGAEPGQLSHFLHILGHKTLLVARKILRASYTRGRGTARAPPPCLATPLPYRNWPPIFTVHVTLTNIHNIAIDNHFCCVLVAYWKLYSERQYLSLHVHIHWVVL